MERNTLFLLCFLALCVLAAAPRPPRDNPLAAAAAAELSRAVLLNLFVRGPTPPSGPSRRTNAVNNR
ncbi:hypothetical protein HPP92_025124 [Vanilla planifolia]|uniref:Uncharacterized protein n=1 Tax=Vanilla planifolia TaxID=51239 RepID=A0A835PHE6_VANPL|nr:hypothetical protein HPP92_025124 [Vanilla planifolia]